MKMIIRTNAAPMSETGLLRYPLYALQSRKTLSGDPFSMAFNTDRCSVVSYNIANSRSWSIQQSYSWNG